MHTDVVFGSLINKTEKDKLGKDYLPGVLCFVCWRMKIRSDPSAKCSITMLKLKLLTAHIFSQYLRSKMLEAAVFLRTVHLGMMSGSR